MENIKSIYCSYQPIINLIGEEKIEESFKTCYQNFRDFACELKVDAKLQMDERVLMHSICDMYADITRLKDFHSILHENGVKTLSYKCSWLLRRKPIKVIVDNADEDLVYINEKFVYFLIMSYLLDEQIDMKSNDGETKALLNYFDTILYYLKYRTCTPQVIEIIVLSFKGGAIYKDIVMRKSS